MKLKILLAALFAAGAVTAFAVAAPPPGKGNPHQQGGTATTTASTSTSTSTTSTTTTGRKVTLCHKTGNGRFVRISVAKAAVAAHLRHGDFVGTDCSKPATATGTTTTDTTTTTTSVATTTTA